MARFLSECKRGANVGFSLQGGSDGRISVPVARREGTLRPRYWAGAPATKRFPAASFNFAQPAEIPGRHGRGRFDRDPHEFAGATLDDHIDFSPILSRQWKKARGSSREPACRRSSWNTKVCDLGCG